MATTRTGHSYVAAVLAGNPSAPIDQATAAPALLSAIKGAFTLAAHGRSSPPRLRPPLTRAPDGRKSGQSLPAAARHANPRQPAGLRCREPWSGLGI